MLPEPTARALPAGAVADAQAAKIGGHRDRSASDRAPELARVTLAVENMNCGGCMRKVEQALQKTPGVASARANLSAKRVTLLHDPETVDLDGLIAGLKDAGFKAGQLVAEVSYADRAREKDFLRRLGVAGFAAMNVMLLSISVWSAGDGDMSRSTHSLFNWLSALIALPAIAYAGRPFFSSAAGALKARRLNMDVPISLGVTLAAGMSLFQTMEGGEQVYFDAAITLLFFLLIGRFLDQRMRNRAQGAAQNLIGMISTTATVIGENGELHRVAANELSPGMHVLVPAGERVPVDGTALSGISDIDESLITGESIPRSVKAGDMVYAGTLNLSAPMTLKAEKTEHDTLLGEISKLMEAAEQGRGRYVRLADRAAAIYAPAVHALALVTLLSWLAFGATWQAALTSAIAVLIITCPCALALAVPAVQVAASSRLFDKGVIVKAPDALERLAEADTIVFDKTGTLTLGVPRLIATAPDGDGVTIDQTVLARAARLAAASSHPYARALVAAATGDPGSTPAAADVGDVREVPGCGLSRQLPDGEERLGSALWVGVETRDVETCNVDTGASAPSASLWYSAPGMSPVAFQFEDELRPDAAEVVAALQGAGFSVELISGDRREAVARASRDAGIDRWRAGQQPQDKIARLEVLKQAGAKVIMIGDGLNDAPALAAAHASLSPSSATELSQSAADAILQGDGLSPIIEILAVARASKRMALQNFAIAAGYNMLFVPLAMMGVVTPLIAAIAMSASSIAVTANAIRLRGKRLSLAKTSSFTKTSSLTRKAPK